MERKELNPFKAVVIDDIGGYEYDVYNKADVDDLLDMMEFRIKELQEENIAKDMACAELHNENKALKERIKEVM